MIYPSSCSVINTRRKYCCLLPPNTKFVFLFCAHLRTRLNLNSPIFGKITGIFVFLLFQPAKIIPMFIPDLLSIVNPVTAVCISPAESPARPHTADVLVKLVIAPGVAPVIGKLPAHARGAVEGAGRGQSGHAYHRIRGCWSSCC